MNFILTWTLALESMNSFNCKKNIKCYLFEGKKIGILALKMFKQLIKIELKSITFSFTVLNKSYLFFIRGPKIK